MNRLDYILASLRRAGENGYSWSVSPDEATALVAEIERLRALEADAERARVKADLWNYYEAFVKANGAGSITDLVVQRDEARAAVGAERAAVATYLRGLADDYGVCIDLSLAEQADIIERGEHRREEEK